MKWLALCLILLGVDVQGQVPFPGPILGKQNTRTNGGGGGGATNAVWTGTKFSLTQQTDGTDASPNAYNFTQVGSPTHSAGIIGNCVVLNGSTQVQTNSYNSALIEPGNSGTTFTISFWIKVGSAPAGVQYIFTKGNYPTTLSYAVAMGGGGSDPGKIRFIFTASAALTVTSASVADNTWHYIACVYDGGLGSDVARAKIYVDGTDVTVDGAGTIPSSISAVSESFEIGDLLIAGVRSLFFGGSLDEATFYNTALSGANVTTQYNSGAGRTFNTFLFKRLTRYQFLAAN